MAKGEKARSMGDVTVDEMMKTGQGFRPSKVVKEGEYVGVDRDADVLMKPGKGYKRKSM